jgi:hypothetical protein
MLEVETCFSSELIIYWCEALSNEWFVLECWIPWPRTFGKVRNCWHCLFRIIDQACRVLSKLRTLPPLVTPSEVSTFQVSIRTLHESPFSRSLEFFESCRPPFITLFTSLSAHLDWTPTLPTFPCSTKRSLFAPRRRLCWKFWCLYPCKVHLLMFYIPANLCSILHLRNVVLYSWIYKENISSKIGLILSFSLILIWGARLPVVSPLLCQSHFFFLHLLRLQRPDHPDSVEVSITASSDYIWPSILLFVVPTFSDFLHD